MRRGDHQLAPRRQGLQAAGGVQRVFWIEARGGLVRDQHLRVADQGAGQHRPRELAAGQGGGRLQALAHQVAGLDGPGQPGLPAAGQAAEGRQMRGEAQRHQALHGDRPLRPRVLRQVGPPPRQRPAVDAGQRRAVERHLARIGLDQPGQDGEQGRLARPVRPDQGDEPAALQVEGDVVDDRAAVAPDADVGGGEPAHGATFRSRTTSQKKNGAPRSAVRTPRRSSVLVWITRVPMSASSSRVAPSRADGSRVRLG